eukprot:COSAG02_NODE_6788_length_3360_cov_51.190432_2_plen_659_part_00
MAQKTPLRTSRPRAPGHRLKAEMPKTGCRQGSDYSAPKCKICAKKNASIAPVAGELKKRPFRQDAEYCSECVKGKLEASWKSDGRFPCNVVRKNCVICTTTDLPAWRQKGATWGSLENYTDDSGHAVYELSIEYCRAHKPDEAEQEKTLRKKLRASSDVPAGSCSASGPGTGRCSRSTLGAPTVTAIEVPRPTTEHRASTQAQPSLTKSHEPGLDSSIRVRNSQSVPITPPEPSGPPSNSPGREAPTFSVGVQNGADGPPGHDAQAVPLGLTAHGSQNGTDARPDLLCRADQQSVRQTSASASATRVNQLAETGTAATGVGTAATGVLVSFTVTAVVFAMVSFAGSQKSPPADGSAPSVKSSGGCNSEPCLNDSLPLPQSHTVHSRIPLDHPPPPLPPQMLPPLDVVWVEPAGGATEPSETVLSAEAYASYSVQNRYLGQNRYLYLFWTEYDANSGLLSFLFAVNASHLYARSPNAATLNATRLCVKATLVPAPDTRVGTNVPSQHVDCFDQQEDPFYLFDFVVHADQDQVLVSFSIIVEVWQQVSTGAHLGFVSAGFRAGVYVDALPTTEAQTGRPDARVIDDNPDAITLAYIAQTGRPEPAGSSTTDLHQIMYWAVVACVAAVVAVVVVRCRPLRRCEQMNIKNRGLVGDLEMVEP